GSREGETYSWPEGPDEYDTFEIYENAVVGQYAIGKVDVAEREYWGSRRPYIVVFKLGAGGGSKQPISVFVAAEDCEPSHEYVAVVRGAGGPRGQRMFSPGEPLPAAYETLPTVVFRDRIEGTPRFSGYNKIGVVAAESDPETMLRHAAAQV